MHHQRDAIQDKPVIEAVIFDMDGVLLDSEAVWDAVREGLVRERGGRWHDGAQRDMMGMSAPEWSRYMHDELGLRESPAEIDDEVVRRMAASYRDDLPLIPGATEAVAGISARWPLGLASSSNRPLIDLALELAGHRAGLPGDRVVGGSRPREARARRLPRCVRRMSVAPACAAAIEDSHNGILAAHAAGMRVIAIPNPSFPPHQDALAEADVVLGSIPELTPDVDLARSRYSTRPSSTQPLWPPRPIAFERATSISASLASFGT